MTRTFRSLSSFNYRMWAGGAFVSNVGTWMQRTAQDWIVLTQLTHHNATAVGVVMSLQFGPQVLLLPLTGFAADHLDRRKLVFATQGAMGGLALGLGILTVAGLVQLWHVYVFAFLLGCVSAFDSPARQTFVSELVVEADLSNAVGLNSTSFNAARMIGPATAGVLIAAVGSGWVFLINAASFAAVLCSLSLLRVENLIATGESPAHAGEPGGGVSLCLEAARLESDAAHAVFDRHVRAQFSYFHLYDVSHCFPCRRQRYGVLSSVMAVGSVAGALLAAGRERPHIAILLAAGAMFGFGCGLSAIMPSSWFFGLALVVVGASAQTFTTTVNSTVQMSTEPAMRGRVVAILLAIALGGTPLGAPIVGWVADAWGPRWAMGIGAMAGFAAAVVGVWYLVKYRQLRVGIRGGRVCFSLIELRVN